MKKRRGRTAIRIICTLLVIALLGYAGYRLYSGRQGSDKSNEVISSLMNIIPGLDSETGYSQGLGRDPLAAVSIQGIDIVGVINIPSIEVFAPVTGKGLSEEHFASWLDGSPVQGKFKIIGERDDVFRKIASLDPGDRVIFTDIDGVRYTYEVKTQYHLKKWDEGDNDLQIMYETDDDTYFVVGCTMTAN